MGMKTYSIFLRDLTQAGGDPPRLLAYEIPDRRAAQALVSVIAASYQDHGFNPATRVHWFRHKDSVHEIYAWPQR
ncbi:hypothetical protein [Methylobacterium brachiatum]|uniref:hypothetical protein n=1 Tax=Methylobacterium brachiatum TaxID=269660 RepID=UPI0008DF957E|nr:hypothetical protein [Methylobacterium brachiatum]SFI39494.1 hypothetical protein SAMN02799642_01683 [Methylobacterium brachiatum]